MKSFAISEISRLCGIKPHTLRIWEKRYSILKPSRTHNNLRFYSLNDLRAVLNISILQNTGEKISYLAKLPQDVIQGKLDNIKDADLRHIRVVSDLLYYMVSRKLDSFDAILKQAFSTLPSTIFMDKVIYPFLIVTEMLYEKCNIPEAELILADIEKKIIHAIEQTHDPLSPRRSVLLFPNRPHRANIPTLYAHYHLKRFGVKAVYVSAPSAAMKLENFITTLCPEFVLIYLARTDDGYISQLRSFVDKAIPSAKIIVATPAGINKIKNDAVQYLSFNEALALLTL